MSSNALIICGFALTFAAIVGWLAYKNLTTDYEPDDLDDELTDWAANWPTWKGHR